MSDPRVAGGAEFDRTQLGGLELFRLLPGEAREVERDTGSGR